VNLRYVHCMISALYFVLVCTRTVSNCGRPFQCGHRTREGEYFEDYLQRSVPRSTALPANGIGPPIEHGGSVERFVYNYLYTSKLCSYRSGTPKLYNYHTYSGPGVWNPACLPDIGEKRVRIEWCDRLTDTRTNLLVCRTEFANRCR
jgi:hypothetical protein